MDIPQMTIAQETMIKLNAPHVKSKNHRRRIRIEGVKQLIRSKPMNHTFKLADLMQAAGYNASKPGTSAYWAGQAFISGLIKSGIIIKNYSGRVHTSTYTVGEDVKIKKINKTVSELKDVIAPKNSKIVERSVSDLTSVEPKYKLDETTTEDKCDDKEGFVALQDDTRYTVSIRLTKKVSDEYDKKDVAHLELHDLSINKIQYMVNKLIDQVK